MSDELVIDAPAPGIYTDVPIEAYHSGRAISNTGLRNLAKSPFHFYSLHVDPLRPPPAEKQGHLEGHLAHCAVLEPAEFAKRFIAGPDVRGNTNEWKAFVAKHRDRTVVKADQMDVARAQARSVLSLSDSRELLSRGRPEVSVYWKEIITDPEDGEITEILCRCRPDWVHPVSDEGVILVDLKTFSNASPREFASQIRRKSYHCQNAFYRRGYEAATGKKVLGFVFIAVETDWPFASSAVMLPEGDVAEGDAQNKRLLDLYARCLKTGTWPSYTQGVVEVAIPRFGN